VAKKRKTQTKRKKKKEKKPEKKKLDILEVAKKKRHLALLEKVNRGSALSAGELKELKRFQGEDELPAGQVDSMEAVARAFGVSSRTVERWAKAGMPKSEEGGYDLIEIQAWRTLRGSQHKDDSEDEKTQWDVKYRQMKALIAEIQYKKLTGDLIPREEVEATMMNRIVAIKRQFLALPKRVAPQLEGLEVIEREELLMDRLKEIIQGFADGRY
jgi:hypothetical protein